MKSRNCLISTMLSLIMIVFITSCPTPIDPANLSILKDLNAPVITIISPVQNSDFKSSVTVSGTIIDLDDAGNEYRTKAASFIKEASYFILNHDTEGKTLQIEEDGSFSFDIETVLFTTQISVQIEASDLNGNSSTSTLTLIPNTDGPLLVITSPGDYSEYATIIELKGYAVNSAGESSTSELNTSISYRIPGTSISGTTGINAADGSFSETIDVSTIDGSRTIEVTAFDLNSNETTVVINIVKPSGGGDISGFTVTPSNKQVTIEWDPVPGAESYSIFESRYGEQIAGSEITGTSYTWTGLTNGEKYTFQLTAHLPEALGSDAISETITKMPLGIRSLAPWVKETGHRSITIEWQNNPNVEDYIVERSLSPEGPWTVRRNLTENEFTDTDLIHDSDYYYRIIPSAFRDVVSDFVTAVPGRFEIEIVESCDTPNYARGVTVVDNYAYIADYYDGLQIIDISNPQPVLVSSCDTPDEALRVTISGNYAYVADYDSGLQIIDISNPANVTDESIVGSCNTPGSAKGVAIAGGFAYVADQDYGLQVIDVSDPEEVTNSSIVGSCFCSDAVNAWANSVAVSGHYAYVAYGTEGLQIIDISGTVTDESLIASCDTPGNAQEITVSGNYAYIADFDYGLQIIDISSPETVSNSSIVGSCSTKDIARGVAVEGNYAFISDYRTGMQIIDISNPAEVTNDSFAGSCTTPGSAMGISTSGNYAYISDHNKGLQIINTLNPGTCTTGSISVSCITPGESAEGIAVAGDFAFVVDRSSGLHVMDISKQNPVIVGSCETPGSSIKVSVAGNYAYVADYDHGLQVIDISNPEMVSNSSIVGSCNTSGKAEDVIVSGDYAFVADYRLYVVK